MMPRYVDGQQGPLITVKVVVEIYTSYAVRLKPRKIPCTYGKKLKI